MTAGTPVDLEFGYVGGRRGADRAVLLAHGAGSDMDAPVLRAVAGGLADAGVPSLRFNYPYRTRGVRAPDRAPVLEASTRRAAAELRGRSGLPDERLVLGGRYCSLVVGSEADAVPALGLCLLGYPLHPAGRPDRLRSDHFPLLGSPVLFLSGTRDALASRDLLEREAKVIPGPVTFRWLETADHGFRPRKASGRSYDDVVAEVAGVVVDWVTSLP